MAADPWLGNVRELENLAERSVIMLAGAATLAFDLTDWNGKAAEARVLGRAVGYGWNLERLEREFILLTLERLHSADPGTAALQERCRGRSLGDESEKPVQEA